MEPIRAVMFDYHQTLVNAGRSEAWTLAAWRRLGREDTPAAAWGTPRADEVHNHLARVWDHVATRYDPEGRRDLDPTVPPVVFARAMAEILDDQPLIEALYAEMLDNWVPYADTIPTLQQLRALGVRTAVLSNIGTDISPSLARHGVLPLVDAVVLSYQVGSKKPDAGIFQHALDALGVDAHEALMVGDAWHTDAAAAAIGVRSLVLPRTEGDVHGLDLVVRMVQPTPAPTSTSATPAREDS